MKVPKKSSKPENIINSNSNTNNTNNSTNKEKDFNKKVTFSNAIENNDKDQSNKNRGKNRSNSLYVSKTKKNNNMNNDKKQNNIANNKDYNEILDLHTKISSNRELSSLIPANKKIISSDLLKSDKEKSKDNKNMNFLLFSMNLSEVKKEKSRLSKKEKQVGAFNLTPPKNKKQDLNLDQESDENNFINNNNEKIKNNEYADILYKNCEEEKIAVNLLKNIMENYEEKIFFFSLLN